MICRQQQQAFVIYGQQWRLVGPAAGADAQTATRAIYQRRLPVCLAACLGGCRNAAATGGRAASRHSLARANERKFPTKLGWQLARVLSNIEANRQTVRGRQTCMQQHER